MKIHSRKQCVHAHPRLCFQLKHAAMLTESRHEPPSLTRAQQNFVMPVRTSSGSTEYIWTGDRWQSSGCPDPSKAGTAACQPDSGLKSQDLQCAPSPPPSPSRDRVPDAWFGYILENCCIVLLIRRWLSQQPKGGLHFPPKDLYKCHGPRQRQLCIICGVKSSLMRGPACTICTTGIGRRLSLRRTPRVGWSYRSNSTGWTPS